LLPEKSTPMSSSPASMRIEREHAGRLMSNGWPECIGASGSSASAPHPDLVSQVAVYPVRRCQRLPAMPLVTRRDFPRLSMCRRCRAEKPRQVALKGKAPQRALRDILDPNIETDRILRNQQALGSAAVHEPEPSATRSHRQSHGPLVVPRCVNT
jgi:hypothetical protein